jgi:hypothetical protein
VGPFPRGRAGARRAALGLVAWTLGLCLPAFAETRVGTADDYLDQLRLLKPGETLKLAPGAYTRGLPLHGLNGRPGASIIVTGSSADPPVFVARAGNNTVSIVDSSYVEVRNLVLDGRGIGVDAVKAEGHSHWAHHITLENLRIVNHGADQQIVGISTKCPAWGWVIRGNIIDGAGTGMYLGASDGSAPFVAGLIESNLVVDTLGYNLQIKHQQARPRLEGMPIGPGHTVIRDNVFSKARNASSGEMARPNVLVGHFPTHGNGSQDVYLIYRNFFYENPTEALFQGEGNIALYNNVMINTVGSAFVAQPHNDVPRWVRVTHNTVLARDAGIRVRGALPGGHHHIGENVVFAETPIEGPTRGTDLTGPMASAADYLLKPFGSTDGDLDVALRRPASNAQLRAGPPTLPEQDRDFDGTSAPPDRIGAYAFPAGPKRWILGLRRKFLP